MSRPLDKRIRLFLYFFVNFIQSTTDLRCYTFSWNTKDTHLLGKQRHIFTDWKYQLSSPFRLTNWMTGAWNLKLVSRPYFLLLVLSSHNSTFIPLSQTLPSPRQMPRQLSISSSVKVFFCCISTGISPIKRRPTRAPHPQARHFQTM